MDSFLETGGNRPKTGIQVSCLRTLLNHPPITLNPLPLPRGGTPPREGPAPFGSYRRPSWTLIESLDPFRSPRVRRSYNERPRGVCAEDFVNDLSLTRGRIDSVHREDDTKHGGGWGPVNSGGIS